MGAVDEMEESETEFVFTTKSGALGFLAEQLDPDESDPLGAVPEADVDS